MAEDKPADHLAQEVAPTEHCTPLDLRPLFGARLEAYAHPEGYWHPEVMLQGAPDSVVVFSSDSQWPGPRFEVFPLQLHCAQAREADWRALAPPFDVVRAVPLWRHEWLERDASGTSLGSETCTHHAGRGPVGPQVVSHALVRAGVLLESRLGALMLIAASDCAPFNVDIYPNHAAALAALHGFEALEFGPPAAA
ncbi:hypothetical protein [Inhella sp.]|uniref:hypothetical protein n=1 Tax=Inhella sp. TaxID=1921806 RepID=UPI0035AEE8A4